MPGSAEPQAETQGLEWKLRPRRGTQAERDTRQLGVIGITGSRHSHQSRTPRQEATTEAAAGTTRGTRRKETHLGVCARHTEPGVTSGGAGGWPTLGGPSDGEKTF